MQNVKKHSTNDNGFVSNYWYDAAGERTVKTSGDGEAIYVNSLFSGGRTGTQKFTAYISPYLVVSQGGAYTKHIYIGSQRIVSKLGDLQSYGADPRRIEYAGATIDGAAKPDYKTKYTQQQQSIKNNYAAFEVPYNGKNNDDYVNGQGFCCTDTPKGGATRVIRENDNPEKLQFYYSSDHLGSASVITDLDGNVSQSINYTPWGEIFTEERNNVWNTPYLFNGKELDEETGLYYYGARYYNPKTSIFLSVDRFAEKYPNLSSYNYCAGNPVKFIEINGDSIWYTKKNDVITMHVTAKVINKSGDNIDMERAANDISSGIDKVFNGKLKYAGKNYTLKSEIHIKAVKSMDEVDKSDHLFVIRDADGKSARGAINTLGGKVMNLAANDFTNDNWFSNCLVSQRC